MYKKCRANSPVSNWGRVNSVFGGKTWKSRPSFGLQLALIDEIIDKTQSVFDVFEKPLIKEKHSTLRQLIVGGGGAFAIFGKFWVKFDNFLA